MAATIAGSRSRKRGPAAFLDDPFAFPPYLAKRGRCSPAAAVADLGLSLEFDPIDALELIFPGADPQLLRDYLEASGNVLDAAVRGFKDYLASGNTEPTTSAITNAASRGNDLVSSEVALNLPVINIPTNCSEWAELVVKEMSSASDLIDAKSRASRILESFEKSTVDCSSADEQKICEEHKILKQMLGGLLHQNGILKRAFLIQHNRLKDYEDMVLERSQFKEIVNKYQERIKSLEDRNYVLSFHLEQSKQHNSISGHYNPDVF